MVEKSAFGRTVLVGSHVMSDVMKFSPRGLEEEPENVPKGKLLGEVLMETTGRFSSGKDPWLFHFLLARQQNPLLAITRS